VTPTVAAILPCRGRPAQTIANVRRLLATAGMDDWELICVVDGDRDVMLALGSAVEEKTLPVDQLRWRYVTPEHGRKWGYWQCLGLMTATHSAPLLCGLANDLLPGHQWLRRAVDAYRETFGAGPGLLGFNDGIHELEHSPHFLIDRRLLDRFGGWPTWYGHNFGDRELCERATELGLYAKAPWAVLYHDHWINGGTHDPVYAEGDATAEADRRLFEERKRRGWPLVSR